MQVKLADAEAELEAANEQIAALREALEASEQQQQADAEEGEEALERLAEQARTETAQGAAAAAAAQEQLAEAQVSISAHVSSFVACDSEF